MTPYRDRLNAGHYQGVPPTSNTTEASDSSSDYNCPDCGRTFTTEHGLKVHQAKTHAEEVAPTGYMMGPE